MSSNGLVSEYRITGCQILGGQSELRPESTFEVEFTVEEVGGEKGGSVDYAVLANGTEVNTAGSNMNQGDTRTLRLGAPYNRLIDAGISDGDTVTISVEISPTFPGDVVVGSGQTTCGQLEVLSARPVTLTDAEVASAPSDGSAEVRYTVENPGNQFVTVEVEPVVDGSVVGGVDEQALSSGESSTSTIGFNYDFSAGEHDLGVRITSTDPNVGTETGEMTAGTVTIEAENGGSDDPCQQDISDAQDTGQMRDCRSETAEMQCPDDSSVTYQAANGCEIDYLKNQGWTELSDCEVDIQNAQESAEGVDCTAQTAELECPDGSVTYQAPNGCEIDYLTGQGWTEVKDDLVQILECGVDPGDGVVRDDHVEVPIEGTVTLWARVRNDDSVARQPTVTWSVGTQTTSTTQQVAAGDEVRVEMEMTMQQQGDRDVTASADAP